MARLGDTRLRDHNLTLSRVESGCDSGRTVKGEFVESSLNLGIQDRPVRSNFASRM
jgi:hypothetical protein